MRRLTSCHLFLFVSHDTGHVDFTRQEHIVEPQLVQLVSKQFGKDIWRKSNKHLVKV